MPQKIKSFLVKNYSYLIIFFILIVGVSIRLPAINFGLPWVVGLDEGFEINRALKLAQGEIDFNRSGKGGLYYLLLIEYAVYFAFLFVTGKISSASDFAVLYITDPSGFYILGRITVLVFAMLIGIWTYKIGRVLCNNRVGILSMALVSLTFGMVDNSGYINVDMPMTFCVLLYLSICIPLMKTGKWNPWVNGAIFALAVITKLPAILLILPISYSYYQGRNQFFWKKYFFHKDLVYFSISFLLIYSLANPAGIVLYGKKIGILLGIVHTNPDLDLILINQGSPINLWKFYFNVLCKGIGLLTLIIGFGGGVLLFKNNKQVFFLLISFPLSLFLACVTTGSTHLYYDRYMVPIYPFIAIIAAFFLDQMLLRIRSKQSTIIFQTVLIILLIGPSFYKSFQSSIRHLQPHTKEIAVSWIEKNIPANTSILLEGNPINKGALAVPLQNIPENYDKLIQQMEKESKLKAKFLKIQKENPIGVTYDLHTFRHFKKIEILEKYLKKGIELFVIPLNRFHPDAVNKNMKASSEVKDSRIRLYNELRNHPNIKKVFSIDVKTKNLIGPDIELYRYSG